MNSRAQVFSLDLLIAAGLIFLAMALVINSIESVSFSNKSDFELMELQYVALTASDRFVSSANPCEENGVSKLNCVALTGCLGQPEISKQELGIPEEYSYFVSDYATCFEGTETMLPTNKPVYAIKRIYLNSAESVKQITFTVWKT